MVLTAKVDDLKSGKVSIPILAGNMVTVGTIDVVMDENGNLSYTYELDEGVELVGDEKLIANTKLNREAFLNMEGIEISPEGTYVEGIKNKTVYLCAKFRVRVPAEKLQDTFHTKKITESEMKRKYNMLTIGRNGAKAMLSVPNDGKLSGLHATLAKQGNAMLITDNGSTNGTKVNGNKIETGVPTALNQNDAVTLGSTTYTISWRG